MEDAEKHAREHYFTELAEEHGWLVLFPSARAGATWWNNIGLNLILMEVRLAKKEYNVDDDRVWMAGFSDGASGVFCQAMLLPGDYAGFVALNGHIGMAGLAGKLQTYAANLFNTPIYAVTNDRDRLYPTATMKPMIEFAKETGADITYREHEGGHDLTYGEIELPLIASFLKDHSRDRFARRIVRETHLPSFGKCHWFAIDQISQAEPAAWHFDQNIELADSAVAPGFVPDRYYRGPGLKIVGVDSKISLAQALGLKIGDLIVNVNGIEIKTSADFGPLLHGLKAGTEAEVIVKRSGRMISLAASLPPPKNYLLFIHNWPSAKAIVSVDENSVDIEASRLGAFKVLVHPDMFDLDKPIIITVNGQIVHDSAVTPDFEFMLRNFLANRDRRLQYVAEIEIVL
jgi:hypothetical protein